MQRKAYRDSTKLRLLGSASVFLMAAGAQTAFAEEESDAANDDLSLVEETQVQTAQAQQQQQQQQQAQQATDEDIELEEIVITGSRIARGSNLDALAPTISLGEQLFDDRGFTNVADALNELPQFANSATPAGQNNDFVGGANFANLFGLGSQRTLTLVDGHRFVTSNPPQIFSPAGGVQVDLNMIPTVMTERTDVVGVGGAPIYGSDAIAGTVNVIMKDDFEGLQVQGQYEAVGNNGGNPESYQFEAAWGANTADGRGNVAVGVQWNKNEGAINREFPEIFGDSPTFQEVPDARDVNNDGEAENVFRLFEDNRIGVIGPAGSPIVSPGNIVAPNGPGLGFGSQAVADATSIFPNRDSIIRIDGPNQNIIDHTGQNIPGEGVDVEGGNGLDLSFLGQTLQPVDRRSLFSTAHYEIFDWLEAYGQATVANTESQELIGQGSHNTFIFDDESTAIKMDIDTPFLDDGTRQALIDAGVNNPSPIAQQFFGAEPGKFFVNRNLNDIDSGRLSENEFFTWRFVGGFRGDFTVFDRDWSYDFSFNFGQSDLELVQPRINDSRFFNAIDAVELTEDDVQNVVEFQAQQQGLDPDSEAALTQAKNEFGRLSGPGLEAGNTVCEASLQAALGEIPLRQDPEGNAANDVRPAIDGCEPLNLLGDRVSPEARDFVLMRAQADSDSEQRVVNLSANGELFELPGGMVEAVIGYETRREEGHFDPSAAFNVGLGRFSPIRETGGDFSTDEGFTEVLAPVISPEMNFGEDTLGFELIDRLEVEGSYRRVDNSLTGSDDIWTAGGRIAFGGVLSDLMIRGNFTESTRNPSIQELFSPRTDTFSFADDPCDFQFRDEGPAPENRKENCETVGLGPNFDSRVNEATEMGFTSGNEDLIDERANALTVGGVLTPEWVPGFMLSVDLVQVNISDRITNLTLEQLLESCFDQDPSEFDPNEGTCTQFERGPDGQIVTFESGFRNASESSFKGLQFQSEYSFNLTDAVSAIVPAWGSFNWGSVQLRANAFHRIRNELSVIGEEAERDVGGFAEPEWNGTFDFAWNRGPMRFTWRVEWQDSPELDPENDDFFEDRQGNLIDDTSARIINNASLSYTFYDRITAQVTVDNILDRDVSDVEIAAGNFTNEEVFGRQFLFTMRAQF